MKNKNHTLGLCVAMTAMVINVGTSAEVVVTGDSLKIGNSHDLRSAGPTSNSIGGGGSNTNYSDVAATIGGGTENMLWTNTSVSVVAGGSQNLVYAPYCAIGGGLANKILVTNGINITVNGVISGGKLNTLYATDSAIGGGEYNFIAPWANYSVISGGFSNLIAYGSGYSTISGGTQNTIEDGAWWAAINGGQFNEIAGSGSGTNGTFAAHFGWIGAGYANYINSNGVYGSIGGGSQNNLDGMFAVIGGGGANTNLAPWGTIPGGLQNLIQTNAQFSTIGGGQVNLVKTNVACGTIAGGNVNSLLAGDFGTIAGGSGNVVSAKLGTIPGGNYAQASHYGQMAYSSGDFAAIGDAQTSVYVLRGSTSNGATSEIFLDSSSARMTVPSGTSWAFEVLVIARSSTPNTAGYRIQGVIRNNSGSTAIVGTLSSTTLGADAGASGWVVTVQADDTNDALVVKVTGAASTNIRWVATVKTSEVTY